MFTHSSFDRTFVRTPLALPTTRIIRYKKAHVKKWVG
ncbi:hypothetical protein ACTODO_01439 [Schaalia dentiphila ATCC 17982]|uniref:Uncharacterized protein n=1 Tax=Schaalia dentiphila ATCC 17982 TaxID=411466 RepID=A7BCQ8_9ACTO|nr:hypothetical protein ACTODO_01439 [Schaalia odontolytica ATCC 17982]